MLPEVTDFCRLVLLRHPELDATMAQVAVGAGDAALSRRGKERVLEWMDLLQPLSVDEVVSAPQAQCRGPAAGIARATGREAAEEPRLRDQEMGAWQGRPWDELVAADPQRVKEFFAGFTEVVPPGGESLGQAVERVLQWWTEGVSHRVGRTVAVVAAGSVLSGFTAAMLGMRLSRCLSLGLPHGGVGVLDVFGNGVRISCWNADGLS